MEAAIVSGILKISGKKLLSLLTSEFAAITGVKKDLQKLNGIHIEIEGFLSTVRDLSIEKDPRFGWVFQLKDVAFDVDDLLYEVHLEAEKHKVASCSRKHAIADILSTKPKSYMYRFKVAQKIKAIQVKLASIAKQRRDMNAIGQNIQLSQPMLSTNIANKELSLLTNVEESEIPTRDREKASVINKLLESNEGEHDWIVSIVGLGGSGKTTLAKHICHDNRIKVQFKDKIYWAHVSQESFNEENLISKVFEAITKEKSDNHTLQHMIEEISMKLTSEKFLLVLDDAWHQDKENWNKFMVHLKDRAPGSKLMLTTRDQKVAEAVKSEHIFNLAYLSQAESWSLFLKNFGWKEEDMCSEFIQVGKEIVNKCGGVPLAIKVLTGILNERREISIWRAINKSDLWIEENIEVRVFSSLKLSYIHLKDHVKECFLFCSIFPKGYIINKNYLIEQWIANGFIKQMMDEQLEVIGTEYFDLLVKVGFLEEACDQRFYYKMHDLIHDLTQYIFQSEVVTFPPKNMIESYTKKCRYLCLRSCEKKVERVPFDKVRALCALGSNESLDKLSFQKSLDKLVKKNPYICSVVLESCFGSPFPQFILNLDYLGYLEIHNASFEKFPDGISRCWNLQSLHFIECRGFTVLPKSIGRLKKLRNLELRMANIGSLPQSIGDCQDLKSLQILYCEQFKEIPNTICKNESLRVLEIVGSQKFEQLPLEVTLLSKLERLNLSGCYNLMELPRAIGNLKRLEFLNIDGCYGLNWMPSGIAQLTCLKRMDLYVVGCDADDARISDLENLNMISGKVEIKNIPHLMDSGDAKKACLKKKKNIQNLMLRWPESTTEEELVSNLGGLDALEPPSKIKKLKIEGYRGSHLPCWMSTQSESSYLECALNETSQPRFLCLVELELCKMPNLKHMRGILVLASLKTLNLIEMPNFEELWTTTRGSLVIGEEEVAEQQCFPILSNLRISKCPKLIVEPYFPPSLERMDIEFCSSQLVSRRRSSSPLLAHTSHHPEVDGESICNGAFATAPELSTLELKEMDLSASDWGFLQHFSKLESLKLDNCCKGLTELHIRVLTSLKKLDIIDSSNLTALPEWIGELHSLEILCIFSCRLIENLRSIEYLTSLTNLQIFDCSTLKQLPNEIVHLTSLRELWLVCCYALTELPEGIGKIPALRFIHIIGCPALQTLPRLIQQRLTAEQQSINRGRDGRVWACTFHLLPHIPTVNIREPSTS